MNTIRYIIYFSIICIFGFLLLSSLAMLVYPGGTILDRSTEGYTFFQNFLSDLGRRNAWNRIDNYKSNFLFDTGMYLSGIGLLLFFTALPFIFKSGVGRRYAVAAAIFGWFSALAYYGIVSNPLDVNYRFHTRFVRAGFIAFLIMSVCYTIAIFRESTYPNHYGWIFILFNIILFLQIIVMIFGPRSFSSPGALVLQTTAQKIVVYAQLACMLYQCRGSLIYLRRSTNTEVV